MTSAADVLATVDAARHRTRRVKRAGWIPLLVFGILVLPASLFQHRHAVSATTQQGGFVRIDVFFADNTELFWYWQLAIPLGYLLVAALLSWRNRRAGVRSPIRAYVVTGVVLVVAVYYFSNLAVVPLNWSNFGIHGMEATVTIGLALFVLAWLERSIALTVAAVVVTGVAVAASQYDIENLLYELFGYPAVPAWLAAATNALALGAALLLCAAAVAVAGRARTRAVAPLAA